MKRYILDKEQRKTLNDYKNGKLIEIENEYLWRDLI